jgi:hypothetical protein
MIHNVLQSVVDSLNEFLRNELNLQEDMAVLTNPVDLKGNLNSQMDNKICVFLQNIEEERIIKNGSYQSHAGMNPPMHFNLYLMFVANFSDPNYIESLRYISLVIEFFQGKYVFENNDLTSLSSNVSKISFEYVNLDFKDLSNVWGLAGLKYMPSVIFKMKLLRFTSFLIKEEVNSVGRNSKKESAIEDKVSRFLENAAGRELEKLGSKIGKKESDS